MSGPRSSIRRLAIRQAVAGVDVTAVRAELAAIEGSVTTASERVVALEAEIKNLRKLIEDLQQAVHLTYGTAVGHSLMTGEAEVV